MAQQAQQAAAGENSGVESGGASMDAGADAGVDWGEQVEFLRGLAAIVRDEELSELLVEQAGVRLSLRSRRVSLVPPDPAPAVPAVALPIGGAIGAIGVAGAGIAGDADTESEEQVPDAPAEPAGIPIVSPMVGVFYRSKSPDDPPFVEVGDRVEVGQIVGLVEAMKTFNEITSEVEGEVAAIVAGNGALVETGAPLVVLKP
jgi:acetyl-CoA carboxylase biotin carboxyl carrier protein